MLACFHLMCIVSDVTYNSNFGKGKGTLHSYLLSKVGLEGGRAGDPRVSMEDTGMLSRGLHREFSPGFHPSE